MQQHMSLCYHTDLLQHAKRAAAYAATLELTIE